MARLRLFVPLILPILLILFITSCNKDIPEPVDPVIEVSTNSVKITGIRSVIVTGQVTADQEVEITERGVCWSKEPEPTIDDQKKSEGTGLGTFTSEINSLGLNTTYYFRAYAIGPDGPLYGNEEEYSLKISSSLSVDSTSVDQIWLSGIISPELDPITRVRGICWDTNPEPIPSGSNKLPLDAGDFEISTSNLTPNTTYYFRTFIVLENDTIYSLEVTENTLPGSIISEPDAIGARHAIGKSSLADENGPLTILSNGICYSTSANPTIQDQVLESGSTLEEFTYILRSLTANTRYYIRAYATNESGTGYSDTISITTPEDLEITYTLNMADEPTADQIDAYTILTHSMNTAVKYYNDYSDHTRHVWVNYSPGVPTADANIDGWMRFGSNRIYMNVRTCLHELAHTVGIGTSSGFYNIMVDNEWTGTEGTKTVRELTGDPNAVIQQHGAHISPFGLNYDSEGTSHQDFVNHCLLLEAMRKDGL